MASRALAELCTRIVDCPHKTAPLAETPHAYAVGTTAIGADGSIAFDRARPVSPQTYEAWIARATPRLGDLILCREAPVGPVAVVPEEPRVCLGQRTVLLRPDPRVADHRWLAHSLRSPATQATMRSQAEGSTVAHLNVSDVRTLLVEVPTLAEQRAIASVLGALDDKIESNRRLDRLASLSWIEHATPALGIGGAERVPVGDLIADGTLVVNDGYRAKNSELGATGIPFLRAGNLTANGLDLRGADLAPPAVIARAGSKVSAPWDTAFTSKGTVGRITLIEPHAEPSVYSPQICFWRSAQPELLSPFVLHAWMRSPRFTEQVDAVKG